MKRTCVNLKFILYILLDNFYTKQRIMKGLLYYTFTLICCLHFNTVSAQNNNYELGIGIYDITGEIAESNFFGYAEPLHRNEGIRDRQYARAYIIQEPGGTPVVFVSIDKGGVFQSMNEAVMVKLSDTYGSLYTDGNVIISATHTHVAAGGCSHYGLYNIATGGHWKNNFDNAVEGIYQAIVRAHNNIAPGRIYFNKGSLTNASINRSLVAYESNVDANDFLSIDDEMTVLKFIQGEEEVGMISWFGVHPTSLNKAYTHNSADNKGYAALAFERLKNSSYGATGAFVAAFANTNAGDMSPNLNLPPASEPYQDATGPGATDEESCDIIGTRQFEKALALYNSANIQLTGSIKALSRYADFSDIEVDAKFTDGQIRNTCRAALGTSFSAGAEDGRSGISSEGITTDPNSGTALDQCHAEKPLFLVLDNDAGLPETPKILPTSIMKIGQFGILAAPAEFTIMSGRRVRATVMDVPGTGITETVLAGYSDAYAGYVSTREEYASQQYEGASTHFGPWTLAAYRQEFERLAIKLVDPAQNPWPNAEPAVPATSAPVDVSTNVLLDDKPFTIDFGDVQTDVQTNYDRDQIVEVTFWGGHPNNDLKTNSTYLTVERKEGSTWVPVYFDRDVCTKLTWKRIGVSESHIVIQWDIPDDVPSGEYRICHFGKWKNGWNGSLNDYIGKSSTFFINYSACVDGYENQYQLTGIQTDNMHFETNKGIDSDQVIELGTNVKYDAGVDIDLFPDFEVILGAGFEAYIEGCED